MTEDVSTDLPRGYHHGNLREALLRASLDVIREEGLEQFSLRAVAKRVGVSAGAPFRHFTSKTALLIALAEEAMALLQANYRAYAEATGEEADGIDLLVSMGRAYLDWALTNPVHFKVMYARDLVDFAKSDYLTRENSATHLRMLTLLTEASKKGILRLGPEGVPDLMLGGRALVFGLARMATDGYMDHVDPATVPALLERAMQAYVAQIRK